MKDLLIFAVFHLHYGVINCLEFFFWETVFSSIVISLQLFLTKSLQISWLLCIRSPKDIWHTAWRLRVNIVNIIFFLNLTACWFVNIWLFLQGRIIPFSVPSKNVIWLSLFTEVYEKQYMVTASMNAQLLTKECSGVTSLHSSFPLPGDKFWGHHLSGVTESPRGSNSGCQPDPVQPFRESVLSDQRGTDDWGVKQWSQNFQDENFCLVQCSSICWYGNLRARVVKWFAQISLLTSRILFLLPSVQFSRSFVSDSLPPHKSQHTRPPCPSPTPRVHSNSCPSSR